jgi:class 3 adenylate cyclase
MDKDKFQELLETRAQAELELEKLRTPVTILFSDIKGSTAYAEKKGDVEYMAMINRHNTLLFPVIEGKGGVIVKTLGDSIMARFDDPVAAVRAGAAMQRVLEQERNAKPKLEPIRIRVGIHTGLGLIRDGDVFGDVVNAAARVQHAAEAEQVLITDVLFAAATDAGFECAKMGRAELKGKAEPIDLYAVAWSQSATQQLVTEVQAQYEKKLKDMRRQRQQLEEDFENAREQWRAERRNLNSEIEQLEEAAELAREAAKQQISEELQSELRFQLEDAVRSRQQAEADLILSRQKFDADRNNLKSQIAGMQARVVEAMEMSNNPSRMAAAIRDQVEFRVNDAKQEWQLQWNGERQRMTAEIERLRRAASAALADGRKDSARRAVLEKLGKLPASSATLVTKTIDGEKEYEDAKIQWSIEREQLNLKIKKLEIELDRTRASTRSEIFQEMRSEYEPKLAEASRERQRIEEDLRATRTELASEKERLRVRISHLEQALPEAQEAARKQVMAELQIQSDLKMEEANRQRARLDRRFQEANDEWEAERRRLNKQILALEDDLKEAKDSVIQAQRAGVRTPTE